MQFNTVQEMNKHYRELVMYSGAVGTAVEVWRDLVFKNKKLVLSGVADSVATEFFAKAVERSHVEQNLPWLLQDYMMFGRFTAYLSYDSRKGYWINCIVHDPDYCSIRIVPGTAEPEITIETTETQQAWAASTDPQAVEQQEQLDPGVVQRMAAGKGILLQPENTLTLARRAHASDFYGTSWLAGILEPNTTSTAELLLQLQIRLSRLRGDSFQQYYADVAQRLRDHICDYVFNQKMFPLLAAQQGYSWTPTVEWHDTGSIEEQRNIVIQAVEQLGVPLAELEQQQEQLCQDEPTGWPFPSTI